MRGAPWYISASAGGRHGKPAAPSSGGPRTLRADGSKHPRSTGMAVTEEGRCLGQEPTFGRSWVWLTATGSMRGECGGRRLFAPTFAGASGLVGPHQSSTAVPGRRRRRVHVPGEAPPLRGREDRVYNAQHSEQAPGACDFQHIVSLKPFKPPIRSSLVLISCRPFCPAPARVSCHPVSNAVVQVLAGVPAKPERQGLPRHRR